MILDHAHAIPPLDLEARHEGRTISDSGTAREPELELDCLTSTASRQPTVLRRRTLGPSPLRPMRNCS